MIINYHYDLIAKKHEAMKQQKKKSVSIVI